MTLKDLIGNTAWQPLWDRFLELYPHAAQSVEGYRQAFAALIMLEPTENLKEQRLAVSIVEDEDGKPWGDVLVFDDNDCRDGCVMRYQPWAEWLGLALDADTLSQMDPMEIVAHCLYGMTWLGFSPVEVDEQSEALFSQASATIREMGDLMDSMKYGESGEDAEKRQSADAETSTPGCVTQDGEGRSAENEIQISDEWLALAEQDKEQLRKLNAKLAKLEQDIVAEARAMETMVDARLTDEETDRRACYQIGVCVQYHLGEKDPDYDVDDSENIVAVRRYRHNLGYSDFDREWSLIGDAGNHNPYFARPDHPLAAEQHCRLFYELYDRSHDPSYYDSPPLAWKDMIRIGNAYLVMGIDRRNWAELD